VYFSKNFERERQKTKIIEICSKLIVIWTLDGGKYIRPTL